MERGRELWAHRDRKGRERLVVWWTHLHAIEQEIDRIDTRELANCKHYMAINLDDPRMEKRRRDRRRENWWAE